jgi:hypothetical protein
MLFHHDDKNDASKNKVKQNLKQSKGCACENSPCRSLLPPRQRRQKKLIDGAVMMMSENLIVCSK